MGLAPGNRLGVYEVTAAIGAGGMGEVYRARDTKLGRDVALKILPDTFAHDEERVARFSREAQLLASLNHPHIGAIYGLDEINGQTFLVLELIDGETLAHRIAKGPLSLDDALPIARQIAEALEAAHDRGIVHRDLKPGNIALTKDGSVKVLDFGLAKATEADNSASPDLTNSPTLTSPAIMTGSGVILGTAAYMSPEQAKGRLADKRSDVWAYGCVLYEMLTGARAFGGHDVSDTLAAVIRGEPDWTALPPDTPAPIQRLLRRCLEKDRRRRLADAADARLDIDDALTSVPEAPPRSAAATRRVALIAIAAFACGAAAAGVALSMLRAGAPASRVSRFSIVPAAALPVVGNASDRNIVISPDGMRIVYVGGVSGTQLIVRSLDQLEGVALSGIANARAPFASPDGRWIGFFTPGELKKVSIAGGPAISLCRIAGLPRGASWGTDDTIVFATNDPTTGLLSVPASGGEPRVLTTPDAAHGEQDHVFPSVLPGGGAVLFTILPQGPVENSQVAVLDRKTGQRKVVVQRGSQGEYAESGYLVYAAAGSLRAVRFDRSRLEVKGDAVPILDRALMTTSGGANFALSQSGTLAYVSGVGGLSSLVWVSRDGREEPLGAPPRAYFSLKLSPDETRVAVEIRDQEQDIWTWDLVERRLTRLTFNPALDAAPIWTPDGRRIIFSSVRGGPLNLFWQPADGNGPAERLTNSPNVQFVHSISPDGTRVLFRELTQSDTGTDLMLLTLDASGKRDVQPLERAPMQQMNGEISPDGGWVAYQSDESGQNEIYVRPFPNVSGGRWQISPAGGTRPVWARSGRELFYLDAANLLTSVAVHTSPTFSASNPTRVLSTAYYNGINYRTYDVSADGQRFLMIKDPRASSIVVVLNFQEELKRALSVK